ncbi:hypothetical protein D3C72_649630 [compost metagenome]
MKRICLLLAYILCIMFGTYSTQAQGFAPLGAEWTYHDVVGGPMEGIEYLYKYKSIQVDTLPDKLVTTVNYEHLTQGLEWWNPSPDPYRTWRDTATGTLKFYEQNDTVWVYNNIFQKYTPLYIFNVQEGDTLRIPILDIHPTYPNATPEGDSVFVLIVDSIRMINYGGVNAETYFVSNYLGDTSTVDWGNFQGPEDLLNPIVNWTTEAKYHLPDSANHYFLGVPIGAYTRLFGGAGQGLLPGRFFMPPMTSVWEGELMFNKIQCFANDTLSFVIDSDLSCDTFEFSRTLAVNPVNGLKGVDIYPNPVQSTLILQAQQPFAAHTSLTVIDLLGRTVVDKAPVAGKQQHTLSVASWNAGTYILILEQDEQRYYRKVQVVH